LQIKPSMFSTTLRRIKHTNILNARYLHLHECYGMEIMAQYGVPTPRGQVARTPEEAEHIYRVVLNGDQGSDAVIKAQILSGGRQRGRFKNGFAGGVHYITSPAQAKNYAKEMLQNFLVTKQTGEAGLRCDMVYLAERVYMRREMYLSIMMDRKSGGPVIIASPAGGTSIEDVAVAAPELIFKESIDIMEGLKPEVVERLATNLGLEPGSSLHQECRKLITDLYGMFLSTDATLIEVNPLAETHDRKLLVCDAKLNFDDNAFYRQREIHDKRDFTQEDPREVEAAKANLNYIGLNGNIGCMVNGAGLAMATMDIIKLKGGKPANFLDVGGGASEDQVQRAFELLNADQQVDTIFVNIFGGIMRCDIIATGMIKAAKHIGMKKPIVVRLQGTNVEAAQKIIASSGCKMFLNNDFEEAARLSVGLADIIRQAKDINVEVHFEGLEK